MNNKKGLIKKKFIMDKFYLNLDNEIFSIKGKPKKNTKTKIKIPKYDEYNNLIKNNYSLLDLKRFCKFYNQKTTGTKSILIYNLYNYLLLSNKIIKIQKFWKGYIQRKIINYQFEGILNRKMVNNKCDFFSLEEINSIPIVQYFSFRDIDGFIYGFNIKSFWKLINLPSYKNPQNPYNRNFIPKKIITRFNTYINLCKRLGKDIEIEEINNINNVNPINSDRQNELRAINVFQNIDLLGNYSDPQWLLSLEKDNLIKFIRELQDIWFYRAQLTDILRRNIYPPHGNPFSNFNGMSLSNLNKTQLLRISLSVIEKIVNNGIDQDSKYLGASYILAALTLVNSNAANSLPWLFQSVVHNNN